MGQHFQMNVSEDIIHSICQEITQDIEQSYSGLSLFFVTHGQGRMRESIALAEHEIVSHPAGHAARAIIQKHTHSERSSFLGLAIASKNKLLGLKKEDHLLGLLNLNKDHLKNETEVRAQIYHLVWHAIDLYEIRQNPDYRKKFRSGPMIPKRSALNLAKANLQADVFSGVLSVLKSDSKEESLVKLIAQKRGVMSLAPISNYKAEEYPSVIAIESCELVIKELMQDPPAEEDHYKIARQISLDVGQAFDEHNIKQWWDFSIPAQDMAWRGFTKEEILGAAVNTSSNPFIRSVAYLIQEVTNIEPSSAAALQNSYNAFVDPSENLVLHNKMIDKIFDDALTLGVEKRSPQAFIDAANAQNEDLTEGRIMGWCANALHDAARAFERALLNNLSPDQAVRMQREGNKDKMVGWDTLKELGKNIVDQRRQGFAVTMGHIAEVCHNNPAFAPILDSLKITMNDPSYVQKLEAANDLSIIPSMPEPNAPEPKAPTPNTPNFMPAPAGPSLGGNNNAHIMKQRKEMLEKQKEQEDAES